MEGQKMRGTPPAVFLPAQNYIFKVLTDHHVVEIPRRGKYSDLAPDFFPEEAGEFDILSENGTLYMPAITKVLFATKKYPGLAYNQLFVPHTFEFKEDTVVIIGQAIELAMKEVPDENEEPEEGE